ncbi:MAG: class I SAM-dependent methyltransferase [Rhizobiaceae bacterium]|nr:class I SAM-dependent methyltransferase [Rhizobiaceae bacterium]
MSRDALKTLFHPFEAGTTETPAAGSRVLFLGAVPGFRLPQGWEAAVDAVQGFRPDFLALQQAGTAVTPDATGETYDMALVLADRHRGLNELRVAEAIERTAPDGTVVVAGGKEDGIASLRKRIGALAGIDGSLSKHHGIAFWLRRTPLAAAAAGALRADNPDGRVDGRFHTAPGMFSHERVDRGSALLAAHLPTDKIGHAADFCAGWGYLAAQLANREGIRSLDLFEADHASLEAARRNLAGIGAVPLRFFWHDLAREPVAERYDTIVMNPPFHTTHSAEPSLGQQLIRVAAAALRRGGRLFLVANRGLPYEQVLDAAFSNAVELARDGMFKVIVATR